MGYFWSYFWIFCGGIGFKFRIGGGYCCLFLIVDCCFVFRVGLYNSVNIYLCTLIIISMYCFGEWCWCFNIIFLWVWLGNNYFCL